jgi:hypothetical protein
MSTCCGLRDKKRKNAATVWKFTHGSTVVAYTFEEALIELENITESQFWASETREGTWDVQLSKAVVLYELKSPTVMEAVRLARWKVHLDKSFKSIAI